MHSILLLIIIGLIRISESLQNEQVCESDNGILDLSGDLVILGSEQTRNDDPKTIFVKYFGKNESFPELNFVCRKFGKNGRNDTKIIFNDEKGTDIKGKMSPVSRKFSKLKNNDFATNKKPVMVECEMVCSVTVVVISFNATDVCNVNESFNCNKKQLENALPKKKSPFPLAPVPGSNTLPAITTYWILDPAGNGTFLKCDELDEEGEVITVGLSSGEDQTESFDCPIDFSGKTRPVIIKVQDKIKEKKCLGLPMFCPPPKIDVKFITYTFTPPQLIQEIPTLPNQETDFPTWAVFVIIIMLLAIIVAIIGFIFYVKYKRKALLTLQPPKNSLFYLDKTPPSENNSEETETTLPSYHSRGVKNSPYHIFDPEDYKIPFQDAEKRKKLLLRQLSGDPTKVSPDLFLNAQATHLDYNKTDKEKYEIDQSKFKTGKMLGGGNYGSVCEGMAEGLFHPGHKTKVAIKTVNNTLDYTQLHALVCEMKVLAKLEIQLNLVNMLGACTSQLEEGQLWLLLEFCPHGDLKSFLCKNREKFKMSIQNQIPINGLDERLIIKWAHSIAKGMDYLSSKKIMHGDLAARNILIGGLEGGRENYVAKISDFGLSRTFYDNIKYKKQERDTVPWKWMDVEYLETGEFTLKSDVWSFGVVLWEILSMGQEPYVGKDIHETISEIKAGSRLPCPNQLEGIDWLEAFFHGATVWCWQADPNLRWSFASLVEYFETYLSEKEKQEFEQFEQEYINMRDLINDDKTRLKRSSSYHQPREMSENVPSASSYSKATTVQIEPSETGNGYHRFAGSSHPGDGGLLVANPSANISVSGGYITPAQAGARVVTSTQATTGTEMSYITMPQAMAQ